MLQHLYNELKKTRNKYPIKLSQPPPLLLLLLVEIDLCIQSKNKIERYV